MNKKLISFFVLFLVSITLIISFSSNKKPEIPHYNYEINSVEPMPIIKDDPYARLAHGGSPIEQRDADVRKWLSAGVKISVKGASGSGTIVYYETETGYAFVQSCGHLWSGTMSAKEGEQKKLTCEVITWYHNDQKLEKPMTYPAEVIYYSNNRGEDCSLLCFKPDWIPDYFPIASEDFHFVPEMRLHSVGCDGGREIAHYNVRVLGEDKTDVTTTENSPRPGRSGGGLLTEDYYVGICWGTTEINGNGNGLFTPLRVVRDLNSRNGYGWLNELGLNWARKFPIIDRNNPQGKYPPDYIPLPK